MPPQYLYEENNGIHQLNTAKNCFQSLRGYSPIRLAGDQVPAVYCCFSNSLEQGPIRILAFLGAAALRERPRLKWQYFGNGKWRDLNVADETKGFQNSGLISFNGKPDFEKHLVLVKRAIGFVYKIFSVAMTICQKRFTFG